jgi:renalase
MSDFSEYVVIGAGITGLLCADHLHSVGHDVTVLEREKSVGGRFATLEWKGNYADYGAQFFTTRDLRFQMKVDQWLEEEACKRWFVSNSSKGLGAQGHVRYCAKEGMQSLARHIAEPLSIRLHTRVHKVFYSDNHWVIEMNEAEVLKCKHLVLTAPLPQSLKLLEAGNTMIEGTLHDELKGIRYQKSLAIIARLDGPSEIPADGGMPINKYPLAWIADNQTKGLAPNDVLLTIHSTADYANETWRDSFESKVPPLLQAAEQHIDAKIVDWQAFEWKYAFPENPWHNLFVEDKDRKLYLAGDAFGGPRVEGAALSGLQCAYEIAGIQQNPEALD